MGWQGEPHCILPGYPPGKGGADPHDAPHWQLSPGLQLHNMSQGEEKQTLFISPHPSALPPSGPVLQTKLSEASCWQYF